MTTSRHFRIGTAFRTRALGLLSALALATAASLAAPAPAAATPVTWTFSGSDTFFKTFPSGGQTDTFSGSFAFDPALLPLRKDPYSAVNITVSGPLGAGTYTQTTPDFTVSNANSIRITQGAPSVPAFYFGFNLPLDIPNITSDTLFGGAFISASGVGYTDENGGSLIIIRRVPEPASLAMLGSALGLFLLVLRLNRRSRGA